MSDKNTTYFLMRGLIDTIPNFVRRGSNKSLSPETYLWLGRLNAILAQQGAAVDLATLKAAMKDLQNPHSYKCAEGVQTIVATAFAAFARAELSAPVGSQGSFIPVGNTLDAFRALADILNAAKVSAFIIDPYMAEDAVTDVAPLVPSGVAVRLLSDASTAKPGLAPAVKAWARQYGASRPLEARLAGPRTLHDRLILIDGTKAWVLTQSLKDLARRSPASLTASDAETATLKVNAYETLWNSAAPI